MDNFGKGYKSHIFYDGRVSFYEFEVEGGISYTSGVMMAGKYRWIADKTENFLIKEGVVNLYLDDEDNFIGEYAEGDFFSIDVSDKERYFWLKVIENISYLCEISP